MADTKRDIRKHLMVMIALVLIIHVAAVGLHSALDIEFAPRRTRTLFTAVWTVVTVAAVLNGLYRIRLARNARGASPRRR